MKAVSVIALLAFAALAQAAGNPDLYLNIGYKAMFSAAKGARARAYHS